MKALLAVILLLFQAGQTPDRWECLEGSGPPPGGRLTRVRPGELRGRVVACAVPRLPGNFDGRGTLNVEVEVDGKGHVRCARLLGSRHQVMRRAALEAAKQWEFEPMVVDGKAKPYAGILALTVSWDADESGKQCPKEKRRA